MSARVSFTVATHYRRPRGESGLTRRDSGRLSLLDALNWILSELPGESFDIENEADGQGGGDVTTLVVDWALVPREILDGAR